MDLTSAATCLEKLGNPKRLEIFQLLVRAGPAGLSVGEIQGHLGVPASTLSHHVSQLLQAGLLRQDREGRVLRCSPNWALMNQLIEFLTAECCVLADPDNALENMNKNIQASKKEAVHKSA